MRAPQQLRFELELISLASTVIDLCLMPYDWAGLRRTKGVVYLHVLLDHDDYLPCFGIVVAGEVHDVTVTQALESAPGTVVVDTRGDLDYRLFAKRTVLGASYDTRMKDHALY